jgi:thioredoxin 1
MPRDFKMLVRLVLSGFFSLGLAAAAWAGEVQPYSADAFAAAQAGGAPIVLHVTADWCPTCHVQRPIVRSLAEDPDNRDLVVFEIDFDGDKGLLRQFGVRSQSTLIAFRGTEERARSVGVTSPAGIADMIAATR